MRVLVVRHYKTLGNANNTILGWGDSPRVKEWAEDLEAVDARLRAAEVSIDAIYSSFLERSRQTAMFYARKRGMLVVNDAPALNEINYGALYRKDKSWEINHLACVLCGNCVDSCRKGCLTQINVPASPMTTKEVEHFRVETQTPSELEAESNAQGTPQPVADDCCSKG